MKNVYRMVASLALVLGCSANSPVVPINVDGGKEYAVDASVPGNADATTMADATRTIPPVTPGIWRNLTPTGVDPSVNPCTDLQFDPSNRTTILAMFGGIGIRKSIDAGLTWTAIGNLPTPVSLGRLRIDPNDSSHLYATGSVGDNSLGFWVSHDGGQTFSIPPGFTAGTNQWSIDVYNIAVDPSDFNHVLMTFHQPWSCCGEDAGILETTDGGTTYIAHQPPPGMNHGNGVAFLSNPSLKLGNANTWLVGGGYAAGMFRTADAGKTWSQVSMLMDNHGGFDAHYSSQGFLYIGASDGVYRSTDNGLTWENESKGAQVNWTYSVISDGKFLYSSPAFVGQAFNQPMFVATEGGKDEGTSWTAFSTQIIPDGPWRMVFDSVNRIIYSANWSGGPWAMTVAD